MDKQQDNGVSALPTGPSQAEPVVSALRASVPDARRRNWRGRFIKSLKMTPEDSREWLIWSRYHGAWHRRSEIGGANGYASDIAQAGIFVRSKAYEYNDGDRNVAFHVTEVTAKLLAARAIHKKAMDNLNFALAQGIEARSGETAGLDPTDESPVAASDAPPLTPCNPPASIGRDE